MDPHLRLADLIAPLSPERFVEEHWKAERPYLSGANPQLVDRLKSIPRLSSVEAYLAAASGDVAVFGPNAFRAEVPVRSALSFLAAGYNLYLVNVDRAVPEARSILLRVAADLGINPGQCSLEAFAGLPGGISSRHYDHDLNFQILLEGEKQWRLEPNRNIVNPLMPFHPGRDREGQTIGFREELNAADPRLPSSFDPDRNQVVLAGVGSVLFLPRGHWHETRSLTATWAVNLVIKGMTWATALTIALQHRLHRDPELRRYCDGARVIGGHAASAEEFERYRRAAQVALSEITLAETSLASNDRWYRWAPKTARRALIELDGACHLDVPGGLDEPLELDPSLAPVVRELLPLEQPFSWSQAQRLAVPAVGAIGLRNLLRDLEELELLVDPG